MRRALAQTQGASALDVPCGTGRIHKLLTERFPHVVSLDSAEAMLAVHRSSVGPGLLCCGDAFRLPFPAECFDWVVCYRLFHHMGSGEERVALLKEVARVGRRGIVFTAWVDTPLNRRRHSRRYSLLRDELASSVTESGLSMRALYFSLWPFQPKCVVLCTKTRVSAA